MIAKSRLKLALALGLLGLITLLLVGTIAAMGRLVAYFSSGADPAGIFTMVPSAPIDLQERVTWLPDAATVPAKHTLPTYLRAQIAGAYLYGWAQWNTSYALQRPYNLKSYFAAPALQMVSTAITSTVAAGWQVRQHNLQHQLELTFVSADGQLVAFTDHNAHLVQQLLDVDGNLLDVQETTNVYAVVMRLEDGNWRIRDLVRRGNGPSLAPARTTPPANFVQVQAGELVVNGAPLPVAGINYYPKAAPWNLFWPEYKTPDTIHDLAAIQALGFNTVRIFVSYADFGADAVTASALTKLTHLLNQAQALDLKVIVTLFDHHTDHRVDNWAADERHLAALIPPFANHPAILAWDLKNEADRDYGLNSQPLTAAWLRHVATTVRRHDPNHLLTIGWSNPEAATALADLVDVVSFHYFDEAATYHKRVTQLLTAVNPKPVLLQEFVLSTWNSFWPHGHSEAEQAHYYAELLRHHRTLPMAGYLVWTLYDFERITLPEFSLPWQRASQAHMGILRADGTPKPAAALLAPGATLDVPPLPAHYRFTKPFWLLLYGLAVGGGLVVIFWWWRWGRYWIRGVRGERAQPVQPTLNPRPGKPRRRQRRRPRPTGGLLHRGLTLPLRLSRWLWRLRPQWLSWRNVLRLLSFRWLWRAAIKRGQQVQQRHQWRRLATRQAMLRQRAARQGILRQGKRRQAGQQLLRRLSVRRRRQKPE